MKGIFYSIMAILLLIPVIAYISFYSDIVKINDDESVQRIVGNKLVSFSNSVDIDLKKAMSIYARRSIGNVVNYISNNGTPIDDSNIRLKELIENNTIYGNTALLNSSVYEWRDKIINKGNELGFDVRINFTEINFIPHDSFNIIVNMVTSVNITFEGTRLYRIYNESIIISIEDYEDPLYTLNTNGLVKNTIKSSPFAVNNVTHLDNLTEKRLYLPSDEGASFFDRLEGRLESSIKYRSQSPNIIGMESIVYQPELLAFGITPKTTQTFVDYLYFNESEKTGHPVNNSAIQWLKIDTEHANKYGVELL